MLTNTQKNPEFWKRARACSQYNHVKLEKEPRRFYFKTSCQSQTGLIPAVGRFVRSCCCTSPCLRLLPVAQWPLWPRSGIGINRRQMDEQRSMFSSRPRTRCCSFLDNFDLKCDVSSLNLRFCFFGQTQARSTHVRVRPVRKKACQASFLETKMSVQVYLYTHTFCHNNAVA